MFNFAGAATSQMITVGGQAAYASPVAVFEIPLPSDAVDDVLLVIAPLNFGCGPALIDNSGGLLIDDLRLE